MGKLQPLDGTECEVKRMDRSTEYSKEFAEIKSQSRISGSCQSCQSNMNRNDGFIHPWSRSGSMSSPRHLLRQLQDRFDHDIYSTLP